MLIKNMLLVQTRRDILYYINFKLALDPLGEVMSSEFSTLNAIILVVFAAYCLIFGLLIEIISIILWPNTKSIAQKLYEWNLFMYASPWGAEW